MRASGTLRAAAALLVACSSGRQALGHERAASTDAAVQAQDAGRSAFAGDSYEPWFGGPAYHASWPNGLSSDASYVPIGVWLQNPEAAERFRAVGINLFIGLWEGPTDAQLDALSASEMTTVCGQSGVWQSRLDDAAISGWLHEETPDNAQERDGGGYDPCIEPALVEQRSARMRAGDPSRPVMLLLGQGVADVEWPGRGSCSDRDDMYPDYARAADLLGFYVYPLARARPLSLVATGVQRLRGFANNDKPVIAMVEASNIDGVVRPRPEDIRAEVWLALVSGAAGVAYFCHRFMPDFSETDCLDDADTRAALGRINREIAELAPALNSPSISNGVTLASQAPIASRLARVAGVSYLFAAALSDEPTQARFALRGFVGPASAEVIGEERTVSVEDGELVDDFAGYGVHLYRIAP